MSNTRRNHLVGVTLIVFAIALPGCNAPLRADPTATPTHPIEKPPDPGDFAQLPTVTSADEPEVGLSPTDTPNTSLQQVTPTPTQVDFTVTANVNANCRTGPLTIFNQYGFLLAGETAMAKGRLADSSWFLIQLQNKPGTCWTSTSLLTYSFDPVQLPVVASPPTPTPALGSISGILWHEICEFTGGEGGQPLILGQGCVQYGPGASDFGPNQVKDAFETGWVGVTMRLGAGACPSTGLAAAMTNGSGAYNFGGLPAGTYCVSYNPLGDSNDTILIPGGPTYPIRGSGGERQTVELDPGENASGVNFGWAFQFFN